MSEFTININPNLSIEGLEQSKSISSINKALINMKKILGEPKNDNKNAVKPSRTSSHFPGEHHRWLQYHPHIAEQLGNERAAMVFALLHCRFKSCGKEQIYKFLVPCNHKLYKKGDSLSEECGLPRMTLIRSLDMIRTAYSSKTTYLKELEAKGEHGVFQGMPFLTFQDKKSSLLYFKFNFRIAKSFDDHTWQAPPIQPVPIHQPDTYSEYQNGIPSEYQNDTYSEYQNGIPMSTKTVFTAPLHPLSPNGLTAPSENTTKNTNTHLDDMYVEATRETPHSGGEKILEVEQPEAPLVADLSDKPACSIHNIYYAAEATPSLPPSEQDQNKTSTRMFEIYGETMKAHGSVHAIRYCDRPISAEAKSNLHNAYAGSFGSDMEKWKAYCKSLTTSRFLMGETKPKNDAKPYELMLSNVCKAEMIEKIRNGAYGLDDRAKEAPKDAIIPLKSLNDSDGNVLKFKQKFLEMKGEGRYKSWVQDAAMTFQNGEIAYFAKSNFTAKWLTECDRLGFAHVLRAAGMKAILIHFPNGKLKETIHV